MRLLLVHLSDLHIKTADDRVFSRIDKIGSAIRGSIRDADTVLFLLTGDIAFAGLETQYEAAIDLIASLKEIVQPHLTGQRRFNCVVIPGNHDLDLSSIGDARPMVIDALLRKQKGDIDSSTVEVCTTPQNAFFDFRDAVGTDLTANGDRTYYCYSIGLSEVTIRIRCCNTALTSTTHEQPGQLFYPWGHFSDMDTAADIDITLLHHPYNWLAPFVAKPLREAIEHVSDIVLTGHEHQFASRSQAGWSGEQNLYIEGGALQGHSAFSDESTFNTILLDTESRTQLVTRFDWDGHLYRGTDKGFEPYQANQLRHAQRLAPNDKFLAWLNDPEIQIEHPKKGTLSLGDIFVYPDVREVVFPLRRETQPAVRGEHLLKRVAETGRLYVTGADKSGKTCLAKRLFLDAYATGLIPVIASGADLSVNKPDDVPDSLIKLFTSQYDKRFKDEYVQLERTRRLVIVDDLQRTKGVRGSLKALIEALLNFAGQIILIGGTLAQQVREVIEPSSITVGDNKFQHYRLLPFGHARRNDLIERWCALDPRIAEDSDTLSDKVVGYKRTIDTACVNNVMPSYPLFILPLLQAQEHGEQVDLNASTYGYFYELLIRRALAKNTTREAFDVKISYLSVVAFTMFSENTSSLSDARMRQLHAQFEQEQYIDLPFITLQSQLSSADLLVNDGEHYWFGYPYVFYYFVAIYLRDRITTPPTRSTIVAIVDSLHEERNANIMLFLAHVSKDPYIAEQLLRFAKGIFDSRARADINGKEVVAALEGAIAEMTLIDHTPQGNRKHAMQALDAAVEQGETREDIERSLKDAQNTAAQLGTAVKTLQILGQVAKNFPGSLPGQVKKEIVDECYGIGLRALSEIYALIDTEGERFVAGVVKAVKDADHRINEEVLEQKTRDSIYGLVHLISLGIVRRISNAVGSKDLVRVYELMAEKYATPAVELVNASLGLDLERPFPEKEIFGLYSALDGNVLAQSVLRGLVINHFQMVDAKHDVKQRVCAKLQISYRALPTAKALGAKG